MGRVTHFVNQGNPRRLIGPQDRGGLQDALGSRCPDPCGQAPCPQSKTEFPTRHAKLRVRSGNRGPARRHDIRTGAKTTAMRQSHGGERRMKQLLQE